MKKYLLTHGDKNYWGLVDTIKPWNEAYCKLFGYIYVEDKNSTLDSIAFKDAFYWEKYRLILEVMKTCLDGDFIAFVDCDAFIKKMVDLMTALPEGFDIAASRYPDNNGYAGWNLGSLFIRVNAKTRKYFQDMIDRGGVTEEEWKSVNGNETVGWEERQMAYDMSRLNASDELEFAKQQDPALHVPSIRMKDLDSKWNFGHACRPLIGTAFDDAVIVHPAERPLEFKQWFLTESIKRMNEGKAPVNPIIEFVGEKSFIKP